MLNLNEEYTFYKDKQFINYCLGCFRYAEDHETFESMQVFYSNKWGMQRFVVDYGKEEERRKLCKLISRHIKDNDSAYLLFRLDFDFNMLPGEEETAEADFPLVRTLFDAYCKEYETEGFLFTHFDQKDDKNEEAVLTKHIHIIYRELFAGPTFSEFLQKHM